MGIISAVTGLPGWVAPVMGAVVCLSAGFVGAEVMERTAPFGYEAKLAAKDTALGQALTQAKTNADSAVSWKAASQDCDKNRSADMAGARDLIGVNATFAAKNGDAAYDLGFAAGQTLCLKRTATDAKAPSCPVPVVAPGGVRHRFADAF